MAGAAASDAASAAPSAAPSALSATPAPRSAAAASWASTPCASTFLPHYEEPGCACGAAHAPLPGLKPHLSPTETEDKALELYFRVLGVDPGVGNLACVVEHVLVGEGNRFHQGPRKDESGRRAAARATGPDGEARCARTATYALTQGHFDKCTGKARRLASAAAINREVAAQHALLATTTRNTSYPERLGAYHVIFNSVAAACQANRARRRVRRAHFTYYMLSTSVMDKFWATVRRGRARDGTRKMEAKTLLAYGKEGPDGHWRGGGPHKRLFASAQRVFHPTRVAKIAEYNTTKTHAHCGAVLSDVVDNNKNHKQRLPHGALEHSLKHCPKCSSLVDRDVNAAINILKAFVATLRGQQRPAHLLGVDSDKGALAGHPGGAQSHPQVPRGTMHLAKGRR